MVEKEVRLTSRTLGYVRIKDIIKLRLLRTCASAFNEVGVAAVAVIALARVTSVPWYAVAVLALA